VWMTQSQKLKETVLIKATKNNTCMDILRNCQCPPAGEVHTVLPASVGYSTAAYGFLQDSPIYSTYALPHGINQAMGYSVGKSGGRPDGTNQAAGYRVSDGRPHGTNQAEDIFSL